MSRQPVDLLVTRASQLITCAPGDAALANGAVAIHDGRIAATGRSEDLEAQFDAAEVIDATGHAICPAFVDPHTHVVYAGDRVTEFEQRIRGDSYLDILAAGGGILSTVRHVRNASVEELVEQTLPRLDEMLRLGTATVEVKTGYGLDTASELKMLAAIEALDARHPIDLIPTFLGAHAIPPEYKDRASAYADSVINDQLPAVTGWYRASSFHRRGIPLFIDVFCEKNAFSKDDSRRVLEAGAASGLPVKAHVDEFFNLGGVDIGLELNAVSLDHLDVSTPEQIARLGRSTVTCVMTPAVNFHSGSAHFAPARALADAGARVALATDINPGSAPCPSMPLIMAIACRYQKLMPAEALRAATIHAAAACGIEHETGSLAPGKRADVLILRAADYRHMMYEFGGNPILQVIKNGRKV